MFATVFKMPTMGVCNSVKHAYQNLSGDLSLVVARSCVTWARNCGIVGDGAGLLSLGLERQHIRCACCHSLGQVAGDDSGVQGAPCDRH